jgi:hypothetical protein
VKVEKIDKALLAVTAVVMLVMLALVVSIEKKEIPALGNKISLSPVQARIISGIGGVEFGDSAWLTGEELVLEVVNSEAKSIDLVINLELGPSPCGDIAQFTNGSNSKVSINKVSRGIVLRGKIPPETIEEVKIKPYGNSCRYKSDPRIFIGSVETSVVTTWTYAK